MKILVILLLSSLFSGCGGSTPDDRSKLSKEQKAEIAQRIKPFSTPNTESLVQKVSVAVNLPGQVRYGVCSACHGAEGGGGVGPALAGRDIAYITSRLKSYRAGEQVGAQSALMWGQAAELSDTDISDLAEYIYTL